MKKVKDIQPFVELLQEWEYIESDIREDWVYRQYVSWCTIETKRWPPMSRRALQNQLTGLYFFGMTCDGGKYFGLREKLIKRKTEVPK